MMTVALDLERLPALLVGPPSALRERADQLRAAGARDLTQHPCERLRAGELPSLEGRRLLLLCAQELPGAELLLEQARRRGLLLWMEDRREFCDFHLPAVVRRGDLTISISTAGRSPALARRLRRHLESLFPEHWAARLEEIGDLRDRLRRRGATAGEINGATERLLVERGWL